MCWGTRCRPGTQSGGLSARACVRFPGTRPGCDLASAAAGEFLVPQLQLCSPTFCIFSRLVGRAGHRHCSPHSLPERTPSIPPVGLGRGLSEAGSRALGVQAWNEGLPCAPARPSSPGKLCRCLQLGCLPPSPSPGLPYSFPLSSWFSCF